VKPVMHRSKIFDITILSSLLLALCIAGCIRTGMRVVPVSANNVLILSADDIIQIMQRSGFTDDQIVDLGPEVQRNLATYGGAQITIRGRMEVIFAIDGNDIFISTLTRGSFVYNIKTGWVTGKKDNSTP
jgi:hypothetical protein